MLLVNAVNTEGRPLEIFVNEVCIEKVMPSVRLPVFHSI